MNNQTWVHAAAATLLQNDATYFCYTAGGSSCIGATASQVCDKPVTGRQGTAACMRYMRYITVPWIRSGCVVACP